ncbi:hypothetical protein [Agreia sp. VKM Ac-1783]|uniref:NACHT domain-containing protein n=1 Tax=Agreia sp. VKM Ac-1783 TaxID=1938889 RepID=UPI000A2ABCE8|nr:hypothetical protein [Agreia sp. VKM Ac-1783]SMQ74936.1 hypothetical protein SAMN06295943_3336 [Agreia sp. VKM Ac-1783]
MDYDFSTLGPTNFEHLAQALVAKTVGASITVFGVGPDGGREASWLGNQLFEKDPEGGFGVLQAKYKTISSTPSENLDWLKEQIGDELRDWVKPDSKREQKPDSLLFATNVRLTPGDGGGKEQARDFAEGLAKKIGLDSTRLHIWSYDEIRSLLDGADDIRRRYAAFVTPGDILSRILDDLNAQDKALTEALALYTARTLVDDDLLNLTQAGTVNDQRVSVSDVFVDLPVVSAERAQDARTLQRLHRESEDELGVASRMIRAFSGIGTGTDAEVKNERIGNNRAVLVGGPGQGKSTITQWLAQVYRSEFLRESRIAESEEVDDVIKRLENRMSEVGIESPRSRPWPFRLILSNFADYLTQHPQSSLLSYMSHEISDRSPVEVDAAALRGWLSSYPWLLLIDGLDEVPSSSNRDQVMESIAAFFRDVKLLDADVLALATTRPQGYNDEFSPKVYKHFHLLPLNANQALAYAQGLVVVRTGKGTIQSAKTIERLTRARGEESTANLFESPLQVTILTVLLEKIGSAPRDRWRLFSQYYKVISDREQEKQGELSELLQKYESEVAHIHRIVGMELQNRSSQAGGASSFLTVEEFDGIIKERFRAIGYTEEGLEQIRDNFKRLVTDRLVFLTILNASRVGFELRSFQEFMAAEHIVHQRESEIIAEIRSRALTPFWRNVVLFAIGSVFANRDFLRSDIPLMCADIDSSGGPEDITRPGAYLALDILKEGIVQAQPLYGRALAVTMMKLMDGPLNRDLTTLRALSDTEALEVIRNIASETSTAGLSTWLNRALSLDAIDAEPALQKLFAHAGAELRKLLVSLAQSVPTLAARDFVRDEAFKQSPFPTLSMTEIFSRRGDEWDEGSQDVRWDVQKSVVTYPRFRSFNVRFKRDENENLLIRANSVLPDESSARVWQSLASSQGEGEDWEAIKASGRFAHDPGPEQLAQALEAFASSTWELSHSYYGLPWVLVTCLQNAGLYAATFGRERLRNRLLRLADLARHGSLGTFDDWEAAERRWASSLAVTDLSTPPEVDSGDENEWDMPVWPALSSVGFVSTIGMILSRSRLPGDDDSADSTFLSALMRQDQFLSPGGHRTNLRTAALMAASTIADDIDRKGTTPPSFVFQLEEARWLASALATPGVTQYASWLLNVPGDLSEEPGRSIIKLLGESNFEPGRRNDALGLRLISGPSDDLWASYRLAVLWSPLLARDLPEKLSRLGPAVSSDQRKLERIAELLTASKAEIAAGRFDDALVWMSDETDSLNSDWFEATMATMDHEFAMVATTRFAKVTQDSHPFVADQMMSSAQELEEEND